jgi:hypothetical protein
MDGTIERRENTVAKQICIRMKREAYIQKPKGGGGYGEPTGINLNNLSTAVKTAVGVAIGIGIYEVVKWGTAVFFAPETLGGSLAAAAATP